MGKKTPEVTPEVAPEVTPEAAPEVIPEVAHKPVKYRVSYLHGLNLRNAPGGEIVRVLRYRSTVLSAGDVVEVAGTMWLPVEGGFVNSAYLNPVEG